MEIKNFNFFSIENCKKNKDYTSVADFKTEKCLSVSLPHDIAFSVTGLTEDQLNFSTNILSLQRKENLHAYYFSEFDAEEGEFFLTLDRVDVYSEVFLNGIKIGETDNAFIAFTFKVNLKKHNEIVIHILPAMIKVREFVLPEISWTLKYNYASAYMRKPMHNLSWDIMPRNVIGGIFGGIYLEMVKPDRFVDVYIVTEKITDGCAFVTFKYNVNVSGDFIRDYSVEINGKCENSEFFCKDTLWHTFSQYTVNVQNPKLWWTSNLGKPDLYDISLKLLYNGRVVDEYKTRFGIRTVRLDRENGADGGKFDFYLNGIKTFIKGTNWVPLSPFRSTDKDRMVTALDLLTDINVNMVRVWGGGVYESDEFYDYCDEHGIFVWQDFMMACCLFPQDEMFCNMIRREAEFVIKRLRNHACIAIWVGDNECDEVGVWRGLNGDDMYNPKTNLITRKIIPEVLAMHDHNRNYLPSSPYIDEYIMDRLTEYINYNIHTVDEHMWGKREFFGNPFYSDCKSPFISEVGYQCMPLFSSLKKFIREEEIENFKSEDYIVHSTSPEIKDYFGLLDLTKRQIESLFGESPSDVENICLQSQYVCGEALKFFIERMRKEKDKKGGILFWNILSGWPQIDNATVDYYFVKKKAYYFVKRVYADLLLMLYESHDQLVLVAINDTLSDKYFDYTVTDITVGQTVVSGDFTIGANEKKVIAEFDTNYRRFYLITWNIDGKTFRNHFITDIKGIPFKEYHTLIKKAQLD